MAKKRISELPAGSALNGTELVAIVQSGTTKRTTAQDIANLGNASGVEGSGTIDYIAKFTASSTIGDSIISDNGTMVTIDGDFRVALADANVNLQGTTKSYVLQVVDGNNRFRIYDNTANEERFTISSTGEANFSDSVTANSFVKSGGTSAQYLKADGSVSTLTNPITGTGTTNYLPKFTGTSALGNSLLQETTNAIGLNVTPKAWGNSNKVFETTFSTSLLGRSDFSAFGRNFFYNSVDDPIYSNNGFASGYFQADGEHLWVSAASGTAGNAISFTQAMTLTASGRLGIGTPNPTTKLGVAGDITLQLSGAAIRDINSNALLSVQSSNELWLGGGGIGFSTIFYAGANERMRILSDGTVCVGRTTNAAAGWQMAVKNGLTITDGTSEVQIFSYYGAGIGTFTNHDFAFRTNNTERMRIANTGNVLIGTTTDGPYKLDVNGVGRFTNGVIIGSTQAQYAISGGNTYLDYAGTLNIRYNFGAVQALALNSSGAATFSSSVTATNLTLNKASGSYITLQYGGTNDWVFGEDSGEASRNFNIYNFNTSSINLSVNRSSGNVGIGTASPARLLNISGTGTDGTQLQINGTGDSAGIKLIPVTGDAWEIQANVSNQFFVYNRTDNAYRFLIDNTGNVGIGSTNPTEKLHIKGSGINTQTLFLESTISASNSYVILGSTSKSYITGLSTDFSNSYIIYDATASALRLAVTSAGNVGIGTASPDASALVQIDSNTQGFLVPRMLESEINSISSPATGLLVYNTDQNHMCMFDGSVWKKFSMSNM